MTRQRAYEYEGAQYHGESAIPPVGHRGFSGARVFEPKPKYLKADNEIVYENFNDARIVIGRDRPGSRISGYGHEHNSNRIDIVVGSHAMDEVKAVNEHGEDIWVDPSMRADAARIYISEKANVDHYFGYFDGEEAVPLAPGKVGLSIGRSAIAVKADAVRILGREGIKLITRSDPRNSLGGKIEYVVGVDIIAGNDSSDLQPMVKGHALVATLDRIIDWIGKMNGIVNGILATQMLFEVAVASHTHEPMGTLFTTFPGLPVVGTTGPALLTLLGPSITKSIKDTFSMIDTSVHRIKGEFDRHQHARPWGREYVCSRFNNVN